jgi:hypothetical protein
MPQPKIIVDIQRRNNGDQPLQPTLIRPREVLSGTEPIKVEKPVVRSAPLPTSTGENFYQGQRHTADLDQTSVCKATPDNSKPNVQADKDRAAQAAAMRKQGSHE